MNCSCGYTGLAARFMKIGIMQLVIGVICLFLTLTILLYAYIWWYVNFFTIFLSVYLIATGVRNITIARKIHANPNTRYVVSGRSYGLQTVTVQQVRIDPQTGRPMPTVYTTNYQNRGYAHQSYPEVPAEDPNNLNTNPSTLPGYTEIGNYRTENYQPAVGNNYSSAFTYNDMNLPSYDNVTKDAGNAQNN